MANTYLTRTPSSTGNDKVATFSAWIKRNSSLGAQNNLFTSFPASERTQLFFTASGTLQLQAYSGNSATMNVETNRKFKDVNGWYHIVVSMDSTQANASDRVKIYVNGVQETSLAQSSYVSQNTTLSFNTSGRAFYIGTYDTTQLFFDGIMSHVHWIDGTAYTASTFGSTDATTGAWKINTAPSLTMGTNGFSILKDDNTITDQSSNSNNLSLGGGTLTKSEDNPSNIFATWNPLWSASNGNVGDVAFSNGNTTTTTSTSYRTTPTTLGMSGSGKYYWEVKRIEDNDGDVHFGVMSENATPANTATWIGNAANGWIIAGDNGQLYTGGSSVSSPLTNGAVANGAIHMCAFDASTGKLYFGTNGNWAGTANPTTGANPHFTLDTSLTYFPVVSTGSDVSANFGNGYFGTTAVSSAGTNASGFGIFEYDVPTGFTALCTKGINSF